MSLIRTNDPGSFLRADGIEFLYAKGIPGDLQFIFWYALLACVISDLLRDAFYTRWTKSVVKDLHPTVQVQFHHLIFNGGMLAFGKTVHESNAGFSFPTGPTDRNLTLFLLFEVAYWTAAPVSSYFLFKVTPPRVDAARDRAFSATF